MQDEKRVDAIQGPAQAGEKSFEKGGEAARGAEKTAYLSMFEQVAPEELSGEDMKNAEWDVILADINRKAAELQEGNIVRVPCTR